MTKKRKSRVWLHPLGVEISYRAALLRATKQFNREIGRSLSFRADDSGEENNWSADAVTALIVYLRLRADEIFRPLTQRLPVWFALIAQFNDHQWRLVVKSGTGAEIPASQALIDGLTIKPLSSGITGVDAYRAEPWLAEMQKSWVAENVRLIKSLPENALSELEGIIQRGVMNGTSTEVIKKQIQERYGVTERRAKLIAVDQTGKANGALTRQRQQDAGITGYFWRGVLDNRERAEHVAREGKRFAWSSPPPDGHPGQPVRCRCYARPDWSGSVFETKN